MGFVYGLSLLIFISLLSLAISHFAIPFLSPLIIGILLGAALSCVYPKLAQTYDLQPSMSFASKKLLRLGIILYGSYITFAEIATLGLNGLLIAILVVSVVFLSAIFIGRLLKLDRDISLLVGIGSAVCGAAAILALESTLKTHPSKSSVALGFIVIFGLIGMVLLPAVYYSGLLPLNDYQWGVFIGASLHEVANVVGAAAISPESQNVAIIVKMTRVVLLVPLLLIVSYVLFRQNTAQTHNENTKPYIPYFAFAFLGVIVLNSVIDWQSTAPLVIESAQLASKFFLIIAMVAIGLQIDWQKFVSFGLKTFILALILFIMLVFGTYALVYFMI